MDRLARNMLYLSLLDIIFVCVLGLFMLKPAQLSVSVLQEASIAPVQGIDFKVEEPLIVRVGKEVFLVPTGFKTDLASIPRWLWSFIAPNEAHYVFPSILHDYLYMYPGDRQRQYIDEIFYSFLLERGVSRFKAYQMYIAVRIFGGSHFGRRIR